MFMRAKNTDTEYYLYDREDRIVKMEAL